MIKDIILRSERPADFHRIAEINYVAFSNGRDKLHVHESEMTSLARQRSMFDPDLSIVAESNNRIVGHVLLVPSDFIVMGKILKGVMLGPICVEPEFQGIGLGGMLVRQGHKIAKEKGYEFSLLCGHSNYYPRFGYIQSVFSSKGAKIQLHKCNQNPENFTMRGLLLKDIGQIYKWQNDMRKNDNLAIMFQNDLMEFNSNSSEIDSIVICKNDKTVAYIKRFKNDKQKINLLFGDSIYLKQIIMFLCQDAGDGKTIFVSQPFEHFGPFKDDTEISIEDIRSTPTAFMICPLNNESVIASYCSQVKSGQITPGVISYPPYVDLD